MRYRVNKDPYELTARFDSKCAETGNPIKKGETCIYYPSSKSVYHTDSKTAQDFYSWKFDAEMLGCNY